MDVAGLLIVLLACANCCDLPDERAQRSAAIRLLCFGFVQARRETEERQVVALPTVERDLLRSLAKIKRSLGNKLEQAKTFLKDFF